METENDDDLRLFFIFSAYIWKEHIVKISLLGSIRICAATINRQNFTICRPLASGAYGLAPDWSLILCYYKR